MGKPKVAGNAKGDQVVPKNKSQIAKEKKNNKNNKQAIASPVANTENVTKVSKKSKNKLKAKGKLDAVQVSPGKKQKVEEIVKEGGDGVAVVTAKPEQKEKTVNPKGNKPVQSSANGVQTMSKSKKKRLKKTLKRLEQGKNDGKTDITKLKKEILQKLKEVKVVNPPKAKKNSQPPKKVEVAETVEKKSPAAGKGPAQTKKSGKVFGAKKAKKNKSKK